ncbi:MAG: galactose oxidase [Pirellulaceae bacterium]|nr:galactose oxidase [Pirellulaceae bacterium]
MNLDGTTDLNLSDTSSSCNVRWFNSHRGGALAGDLAKGCVQSVSGGGNLDLGTAPFDTGEVWLVDVKAEQDDDVDAWLRWQPLVTTGDPNARHEAGFIECDGRMFLLGGRRIQSVDIFDPQTQIWTHGSKPPMEVHHFQPVVWDHRIWLAGAMTGRYPRETAIDRVLIYDPRTDQWSWGPEIPVDRRRGGAGAVVHGNSLYLVCGIQNGHWDGWVPWLDRLDLKTQTWEQLPDAPRVRDHFQAAIIGGKLYAAGGRKTSAATKHVFDLTIPQVDVFDLQSGAWSTLPDASNLPVPRAGCFTFCLDGELLIAGGESDQKTAHEQIHAFDPQSGTWRTMSVFDQGRHGTGIGQHGNTLYTAAGAGSRGGSMELNTTEILVLPSRD